jgi:hypothetical protein
MIGRSGTVQTVGLTRVQLLSIIPVDSRRQRPQADSAKAHEMTGDLNNSLHGHSSNAPSIRVEVVIISGVH